MGKRMEQAREDRIIGLYKSGLNCGQIAREIGSHRVSVRAFLISRGFKIRKSCGRGHLVDGMDIVAWVEDYNGGMPVGGIASKYGVAKSTVMRKLKRFGLVLRTISKAKTKVTPSQKRDILEMYSHGLSMSDCGRETGVCLDTVCRVLKENNVTISKGRRIKFRRKSDQEKIVRMYTQGWSLALLGDELGVGQGDVMAVLRLHGIKARPSAGPHEHVVVDKKGREFRMRNGWEVAYAKYLDANSIEWDYERESFCVGTRMYTPDFWIYDNRRLMKVVEIRGWYTAEAKNLVKAVKAKYHSLALSVLRENDLKRLGVL